MRLKRPSLTSPSSEKPRKGNSRTEAHPPARLDLSQVEFHRHGMALIPKAGEKGPGMPLMVEDPEWKRVTRFCSCPVSKSRTCRHLIELSKIWKSLDHGSGVKSPWEDFRKSLWRQLAQILGQDQQCPRESVSAVFLSARQEASKANLRDMIGDGRIIKVTDPNGDNLLHYLSSGADTIRFLDRCGRRPGGASSHRTAALDSLALMNLTANERRMKDMGSDPRTSP